MEDDNSDQLDEEVTIDDLKRNSQNRIIAIFLLYVITLLLFLTGRQDTATLFDRIIIIILIANSIYLVIELIKYRRLASYNEEIIKEEQ